MSARAFVAGGVLVIAVMLGWGGFALGSYALWELVAIIGELVQCGRRSLLYRQEQQ